jgi:hypothetical protein
MKELGVDEVEGEEGTYLPTLSFLTHHIGNPDKIM